MSDPQPGATPSPDEPCVPRAVLPEEVVFLEDAAQPAAGTVADVVLSADRPRPPGPGIWESMAWMVGVHHMQLVAGAAAAVVLVAAYLATTDIGRLEKSIATPAGLDALSKAVGVSCGSCHMH